ncbi:MAG: hypothetical protein ACREX4_14445 [Gammaproteobacteria bacterium]
MSERSRLEAEIARKLEALAAEDMQRLAEDYARLRYPERFPRYDWRAFSPQGKSRSGWPDAGIVLEDGRVDGVEATTDKLSAKIQRHLAEDMGKARTRTSRLAGFVFVSGNPKFQPPPEALAIWQQRFVDEGGVDPGRVDLVFGVRLMQELARPEFARIRREILNLSDYPSCFKLVRVDSAPDKSQRTFIPAPKDYADGQVHRPKIADKILEHLERESLVLVRGIGASGKTVLAWQLALETAQQGWPAYYADLVLLGELTTQVGNALADDLCRFGHPRVLLVLDNIHLDEDLAGDLVLAWRDLAPAQRPCLLLVGRELRTRQGSSSPIKGVDVPTVTLRAQQEEVRGVYRRLASRQVPADSIPEPPSDALDQWVKTFGGDPHSPDTTTDLIAFSAAVLKRMTHLLKQQDWTLKEEDAIEEIREAYLKKVKSSGEIRNLMRLSALADLEFPLHERALTDQWAGFDVTSRRLGLVFREEVGADDRHVRYRLAHTALGRLVMKAAPEEYQVDQAQEQLAVALAQPYSGFALVHRLSAVGQSERAAEILAKLMEEPTRLLDLGSLSYWHNTLRQIQRLDAALLTGVRGIVEDPANRARLIESPRDASGPSSILPRLCGENQRA